MLENPVPVVAAAGTVEVEIPGERRQNEEGGGVGGGSAVAAAGLLGEQGGERNSESGENSAANNRWPQEETLALLRIRSEMDPAFRDSSLKAPLWDEVSRKLAELGYHRSAKKCKEKFENIYKYHKRTKKCQYTRSNGKAYRFFDQLEALDHHQFSFPSLAPEQTNVAASVSAMETIPVLVNPQKIAENTTPSSYQDASTSLGFASASTSSSYGNDSEGGQKKRKKWEDFFDKLTKSVLEKQEDLQKKFLEALEKCERDRVAREEAWKKEEMARIKREQELLMQERSIAAAKDAAVLAFLQKISEQGKIPVHVPENMSVEEKSTSSKENDNGICPTRWPKDEVEALIRLRANMELECQDNGPKGPLWEEISEAMKKLGYHRSAKRCKEKWENINKYFRRVRDSNKKRPIDSKTCPYFQQLEALYQVKRKKFDNNSDNSTSNFRPEELLMHIMNHNREEQQEKQQKEVLQHEQGQMLTNLETSDNENQDEDEDYGEGDYQIVANDSSAGAIME
ncbi:hypothetical protein Ancab_002951 [Ancistrocladus abbreviatus]